MDLLEIVKALGPVGVAFMFIMNELREQRRETRRRDATARAEREQQTVMLALVCQQLGVVPPRRATFPARDLVDTQRLVSRRARTVSDDPDDGTGKES